MTGTAITPEEANALILREALLLDERDWDGWLALYEPDCTFWMPAWRNEGTTTTDPDSEMSLIYYQGRRNLEDRVWRLRSGTSVASSPLPRVAHLVTNILVGETDEAGTAATASFATHSYDVRAKRTHVFFGRYRYRLRRTADGPRIAGKTILLMNDVIPTVLDFYSV